MSQGFSEAWSARSDRSRSKIHERVSRIADVGSINIFINRSKHLSLEVFTLSYYSKRLASTLDYGNLISLTLNSTSTITRVICGGRNIANIIDL